MFVKSYSARALTDAFADIVVESDDLETFGVAQIVNRHLVILRGALHVSRSLYIAPGMPTVLFSVSSKKVAFWSQKDILDAIADEDASELVDAAHLVEIAGEYMPEIVQQLAHLIGG